MQQGAERRRGRRKGYRIETYSAGMASGGVDQRAVKVMTEAGIDISGRVSKSIDAFGNLAFDYVITHCDNEREACPIFPAKTMVLHVGFNAPPRPCQRPERRSNGALPEVRDEIAKFVETLPDV